MLIIGDALGGRGHMPPPHPDFYINSRGMGWLEPGPSSSSMPKAEHGAAAWLHLKSSSSSVVAGAMAGQSCVPPLWQQCRVLPPHWQHLHITYDCNRQLRTYGYTV